MFWPRLYNQKVEGRVLYEQQLETKVKGRASDAIEVNDTKK